MAGTRKKPESEKSQAEEFIAQLDEEQTDIWEHRFSSGAFVRAYAWAAKKGNGPKGCLVYADAHENDFEDSESPVVQKDG